MGRDSGGDEPPETHNEIGGGHFEGPVGQFGAVNGDVNMHWSRPQDPAELARAMEEAVLRAQQARDRARREEAERRENARVITCLVGFALLFAVFFFLFDLWWWVSALIALAVAGKVYESME